jgi:hypothetical protein
MMFQLFRVCFFVGMLAEGEKISSQQRKVLRKSSQWYFSLAIAETYFGLLEAWQMTKINIIFHLQSD